ncbi:MAG: DUF4330 family protein [Ruminococcaceae bacterium]|nr:DUF4330 family protein [Oscillospiraceae bacterium]
MVEKRKKARFNWIDALIVIFILAVIATAAYFLIGSFKPDENQGGEDFKIEIRIENVKKESLESLESLSLLQPETVVKDAVTGEEIGKIFSVRTEKSRYYGGLVEDENGYTLGTAESEDEYDVYITISTDAEQDSRGIYTVNGIRMLIGETVHFKIKSFAATAYIVKTEVPNETQT